jgi:hypothetical protein
MCAGNSVRPARPLESRGPGPLACWKAVDRGRATTWWHRPTDVRRISGDRTATAHTKKVRSVCWKAAIGQRASGKAAWRWARTCAAGRCPGCGTSSGGGQRPDSAVRILLWPRSNRFQMRCCAGPNSDRSCCQIKSVRILVSQRLISRIPENSGECWRDGAGRVVRCIAEGWHGTALVVAKLARQFWRSMARRGWLSSHGCCGGGLALDGPGSLRACVA